MKDINKVILLGRLGADPIQRHTKTGRSVVHFSIATKRQWTPGTTQSNIPAAPVQETQWHRIVSWGKLGETCAQFLRKGNCVYVEGSLRCHAYSDKTGTQKWSTEIYAENISFIDGVRPPPKQNLVEAS